MAKADTELDKYRRQVTRLIDDIHGLYSALAIIEGAGADDTARQAFFAPHFTNTPDYDVTATEFFQSVTKLRELKTWLETAANRVPLYKIRQ